MAKAKANARAMAIQTTSATTTTTMAKARAKANRLPPKARATATSSVQRARGRAHAKKRRLQRTKAWQRQHNEGFRETVNVRLFLSIVGDLSLEDVNWLTGDRFSSVYIFNRYEKTAIRATPGHIEWPIAYVLTRYHKNTGFLHNDFHSKNSFTMLSTKPLPN